MDFPELHDLEIVEIGPEHHDGGIYVEGVIPESGEAKVEVRNILPDQLEVEFEQPAISDMMD